MEEGEDLECLGSCNFKDFFDLEVKETRISQSRQERESGKLGEGTGLGSFRMSGIARSPQAPTSWFTGLPACLQLAGPCPLDI